MLSCYHGKVYRFSPAITTIIFAYSRLIYCIFCFIVFYYKVIVKRFSPQLSKVHIPRERFRVPTKQEVFMQYYYNSPLLFERGISAAIDSNHISTTHDACYNFDFDCRSHSVNMEFPHFHTFYEIMILLSPKAYHFVEGKRYDIVTNDMVLLAPSILHQSEYLPGSPSDRIIIGFTPPSADHPYYTQFQELLLIFNNPCPIFRFEPKTQNTIYKIFNEITVALQSEDTAMRNLIVHTKFTEFLLSLYHFRNENKYSPNLTSSIQEKIYTITNYIHTHYSEDISLNSLAETFFVSPYYLSHQFKQVTGYTVVQYIQMTRIKNVQYLLLNSDMKISEISACTGFSSFSQFNRVFRKFCKISPSDYKANAHPVAYRMAFENCDQ